MELLTNFGESTMKIKGFLANTPERHAPRTQGAKPYFTMRVAENFGTEKNKKTVWFDVVASISPMEADMLQERAGVEVDGRLEATAYISKQALAALQDTDVPSTWEDVIAALKKYDVMRVGLKMLTQDVRPCAISDETEKKPSKPDPKARIRALLAEQADITARVGTLQQTLPSVLGTDKMSGVMAELTKLNDRSQAIKAELDAMEG